MNPEIKTIVAELRKKLEKLYGGRIVRLVLFGSYARGEDVSGSDIDILVVLKGTVKAGEEIARTGCITAELSLEKNVVISCTFISEERYNTEQSPLLINVRREGVIA
jgi:predicted nucleotidyltransferase